MTSFLVHTLPVVTLFVGTFLIMCLIALGEREALKAKE